MKLADKNNSAHTTCEPSGDQSVQLFQTFDYHPLSPQYVQEQILVLLYILRILITLLSFLL
jgi:hypothetical protein